jgi:hypothetical protein
MPWKSRWPSLSITNWKFTPAASSGTAKFYDAQSRQPSSQGEDKEEKSGVNRRVQPASTVIESKIEVLHKRIKKKKKIGKWEIN